MAYIYKKKIGKKEYYYLRESVRDKGKTITRDIAYLGSSLNEKKVPKKYLKEFRDLVKKGQDRLVTLKDKDPWILGEDIPDCDLFFSQIWMSCFTNDFEHPSGRAYKKIMSIFKGYHLWFYFGEKDSDDVGENIVQKFVKDPGFAQKVNREIIKEADKLRNFSEKIPQESLSRLSDKKMWYYYDMQHKIHQEYYQWCWIPVAADMFHNNFTNVMKKRLKGGRANEHFTILTQPTKKSLIRVEQEEFLQIASKIQKDPYHKKLFKDLYRLFEEKEAAPYGLKTHTKEYEDLLEERIDDIRDKIKLPVYRMIEKHYEKYYYVKFMWIGVEGVHSFNHYMKEFVKFIGRNSDAIVLLKEKQKEFEENDRKRGELIRKLKITGKWKILFDEFGDFMVTKIYRRYAQIYAIYRMQPILDEVSRRLKISKMAAHFILPQEVKEGLLGGNVDRDEMEKRTKFCVHYSEKGNEKVFTGKKAKDLAKVVETKVSQDVEEINGQTGCIGKAKGTVKIVIRPSDMAKMKKGDILVSIATDPDIVPAMQKAAAIVTEQGGVTSHAAIVSRELRIPCVIGTKIATKVLKDGDVVEVDADKGVVKKTP